MLPTTLMRGVRAATQICPFEPLPPSIRSDASEGRGNAGEEGRGAYTAKTKKKYGFFKTTRAAPQLVKSSQLPKFQSMCSKHVGRQISRHKGDISTYQPRDAHKSMSSSMCLPLFNKSCPLLIKIKLPPINIQVPLFAFTSSISQASTSTVGVQFPNLPRARMCFSVLK